MELITMPELHAIRHIWVFEKHEIEDSLPRIFEDVTGAAFTGRPLDEHLSFTADDVDTLREICGEDELHFEMTRSLIAVERRYRTMARRAGLFTALEDTVRKSFYDDKDDAVSRARQLSEARDVRKNGLHPSALLELGNDVENSLAGDFEPEVIDVTDEEAVDAAH
jgi:DNA sulfur modification protein DndC